MGRVIGVKNFLIDLHFADDVHSQRFNGLWTYTNKTYDFRQYFFVRRKIFVLHDLRLLRAVCIVQTMSTLK